MSRVIIKFKDGEYLNIPGGCIDLREGWVFAWHGEYVVAIVKAEEIISCHISEKRGEAENDRIGRNSRSS